MEHDFCPNCGENLKFREAEICPNCGVRIKEPSKPEEEKYAGFWIRFVAYIIDTIIIAVVCFIVLLFSFVLMGSDAWMIALAYVFCICFSWLYFACQESSPKQATIGKQALGLVVTDPEYQRISFGRATGRWIAKIISALILYIGFIMIGFTERKQGLHDMIVSTYVCYKSRL
jgi:uncharacterized RDD family membrane protein YckC